MKHAWVKVAILYLKNSEACEIVENGGSKKRRQQEKKRVKNESADGLGKKNTFRVSQLILWLEIGW